MAALSDDIILAYARDSTSSNSMERSMCSKNSRRLSMAENFPFPPHYKCEPALGKRHSGAAYGPHSRHS
ncbi:unnamed protein product, partial [Iphiclides podalirius]